MKMKLHYTFVLAMAMVCTAATAGNPAGVQGMSGMDTRYVPVMLSGSGDMGYVDVRSGSRAQRSGDYEYASWFHEGIALACSDDARFIDTKFHDIIGTGYADATIFSEGLAFVTDDGSSIYAIDRSGRTQFSLDEDIRSVWPYYGGFAVICDRESRYGLIDHEGRTVLEPRYDEIVPFVYGGYACVEDGEGCWGVIDCSQLTDGGEPSVIVPANFEEIIWESAVIEYGYIPVSRDGLFGLYDLSGREVLPCAYDYLFPDSFGEKGRGAASSADKYDAASRAAINAEGCVIAFMGEEGSGWMTPEGKVLISKDYSIDVFARCGKAPVQDEDGSWGFINRSGSWYLPPEYDFVYSFDDCLCAMVGKDRRCGLINLGGETVLELRYDDIDYLGEGLYYITSGLRTGLAGSRGQILIRPSEEYSSFPYPETDWMPLELD